MEGGVVLRKRFERSGVFFVLPVVFLSKRSLLDLQLSSLELCCYCSFTVFLFLLGALRVQV